MNFRLEEEKQRDCLWSAATQALQTRTAVVPVAVQRESGHQICDVLQCSTMGHAIWVPIHSTDEMSLLGAYASATSCVTSLEAEVGEPPGSLASEYSREDDQLYATGSLKLKKSSGFHSFSMPAGVTCPLLLAFPVRPPLLLKSFSKAYFASLLPLLKSLLSMSKPA